MLSNRLNGDLYLTFVTSAVELARRVLWGCCIDGVICETVNAIRSRVVFQNTTRPIVKRLQPIGHLFISIRDVRGIKTLHPIRHIHTLFQNIHPLRLESFLSIILLVCLLSCHLEYEDTNVWNLAMNDIDGVHLLLEIRLVYFDVAEPRQFMPICLLLEDFKPVVLLHI